MSKKYYWLKLNDNFFDDDTIVWIEEQENGKDYIIFYLKLLLKSLKEEGKLIRYVGEMVMPYDTKALAKLTNTNYDTVDRAMILFINIGLIQRIDTGELYLTQIDEMIGSETAAAERMRKMRAKENDLKLPNNTDRNNVQNCYTEIEIEKEIEKDIELEKESTLSTSKEVDRIPYQEVIDYLNDKTEKNFRNVESNKKLIRARFNESYQLDDFKKVIDVKTQQWLGDNNMQKYLRPSTLFGTKFDTYLNEELKVVEEKRDYGGMKIKEEKPAPSWEEFQKEYDKNEKEDNLNG